MFITNTNERIEQMVHIKKTKESKKRFITNTNERIEQLVRIKKRNNRKRGSSQLRTKESNKWFI